jgi:hypothetical protein
MTSKTSGFKKAKHRMMAEFLADGLSQAAAFTKAGFRDKNPTSGAAKLLQRNSSILQWRDEILEQRAKVTQAAHARVVAEQVIEKARTLDRLIDDLYRIKDMAMTAVPVLDNKGVPTGEYRADYGNAINAIKTIGQQLFGAFVTKSQSVPADPRDAWTDEQVREILKMVEEHERGLERAGGAGGASGVPGKKTH